MEVSAGKFGRLEVAGVGEGSRFADERILRTRSQQRHRETIYSGGMVLTITLVVWLAAEVVLQTRQYFQGERAKTTEWGSLGFLIITAFLAGALANIVGRRVPALDLPIHGPGWYVPIVAIVWFGIGFRLWAIISLGRYFRGIVHIQEGHRVVRSGPYRVLRHPSYAGLLLALFGIALTFANLAAIVIYFAGILAGVLYRIRVEERILLDGLGEDYAQYMRETDRLVPGVW